MARSRPVLVGTVAKSRPVLVGDERFWLEAVEGMGIPLPKPKPVLIVDDERENLAVLGAVLDDEHEVHLAANGAEALAILEKVGELSVVISDQRMPGMTGLQVLAAFASRSPETVRMLVTAYADVEPVVAAVNQGKVYSFFLKPWDRHEVRAAVAAAVSQYRARSALGQMVGLLVHRKQELARTLEELELARDRLLASERLNTLGRFTAGMSHSVRNSLALMTNLVGFVREKPVGPMAVSAVKRANALLESLLPVIEAVQAFARGEVQQARRARFSAHPFVEEVRTAFQTAPLGRTHELKTSIDANAASLVLDRKRVRQALLALLAHAADASVPGKSMALKLRLGADGGWRFELTYQPQKRDGAGRAADADTAVAPGFGFGIEIARAIALAHGGRLELGAQAGREARTSLWLGPPASASGGAS